MAARNASVSVNIDSGTVRFEPLSPVNWALFEKLFGPRGACGGCWCMHWRLTRADYEINKGEGNKRAMKKRVKEKSPVGVMAVLNNEAIGWISLGPREHFVRLNSSRVLKPVDDTPVWSIVCFYIKPPYRKLGLSVMLIRESIQYARKMGASALEAYPVDPLKKEVPGVFAFTGLAAAFHKAGFREVARNSETRPIVRLTW